MSHFQVMFSSKNRLWKWPDVTWQPPVCAWCLQSQKRLKHPELAAWIMKRMNYQVCFKSACLASGFRTGGGESPWDRSRDFPNSFAENLTLIMRMRSHRITVKYLIGFYRVNKIQKIKFFRMTFPPLRNQENLFCECNYPTSNSGG